MCSTSKDIYQEQITFTLRQFASDGSGFASKLKKVSQRRENDWLNTFKPAAKVAAPFIGMAVEAK